MPELDESMAWGYTKVQYFSPFKEHTFKFHHRQLGADGVWSVSVLDEITIEDTLNVLLSTLHGFFPTGTTFGAYTVYKNHVSPTPTEFWLTGAVPTLDTSPSGGVRASAQVTINLRTTKNRVMKLTTLDSDVGLGLPFLIPQGSFAGATATLIDYLLDNDNITTIDGENVAVGYSITGTINKLNERKYGKKENTL